MQSITVMRALLGTILMCSATALATPGDAPPPAPMGPSGSARPVDPYQQGPVTSPSQQSRGPVTSPSQVPAPPPDTSSGAPAPSQQQAPAKEPEPGTQQAPAKAQEPGTPAPQTTQPPASEGKPNPVIDKPAPAPVDMPQPTKDSQSSREAPGSAAKSDPGSAGPSASNAPGAIEPNGPDAPSNTAAAPGNAAPGGPADIAAVEPATPEDDAAVEPAKPPGPVVDVENAPPACRDAGKLATSRDRSAALSAKISFAICTANAALATLQLVDAEASVQEVDRATSNSFGLLDEVATAGDPKWAIVALHAAGDLLATMTKRMTDTVATNQPAELRDMRAQMLQPHLQPWIERTQKAFAEVDRLANANPQVAKSQVVATAVADSRKRMAAAVATR